MNYNDYSLIKTRWGSICELLRPTAFHSAVSATVRAPGNKNVHSRIPGNEKRGPGMHSLVTLLRLGHLRVRLRWLLPIYKA